MVEDMGNLSKVILDGAEKNWTSPCPDCHRMCYGINSLDATLAAQSHCSPAAPTEAPAQEPELTLFEKTIAFLRECRDRAPLKFSADNLDTVIYGLTADGEIAKLRAELEQMRARNEILVRLEAEYKQSLAAAESSVTRLTRERDGLNRISELWQEIATVLDEAGIPGIYLDEGVALAHTTSERVKMVCGKLETAERERDQAREALRYLLMVRNIKCQHKHPGPDKTCANCRALAALVPANAEKER